MSKDEQKAAWLRVANSEYFASPPVQPTTVLKPLWRRRLLLWYKFTFSYRIAKFICPWMYDD